MNTAPTSNRLILDHVYAHAAEIPDKLYLIQPIGFGEVRDYNWQQVVDQARRMAAHLRAKGFEPGVRIAILSKNCAHFIIAEIAIWMAGGTTVAIFPTETAETIRYVLQHSEARLLFVGKLDTWDQQSSAVPEGLPCIALPLAPATDFETWDAIIARSEPLTENVRRAPDDMALICYTSGSTGQPKGVMHSFGRISDVGERIVAYLKSIWVNGVESRVLSYLPLAHVFERAWLECASLVDGTGQIYFCETQETFLQDLNRARPNSFISVPRLWQLFQQSVFAKMPPDVLDRMLADPASGPVVARQVLQGLGLDQVITASSGSAPIPTDLIDWYRRLGLNLLEGYGMTEDFAYSFSSTPEYNASGCVGVALPGVEARIGEDGEILIKSPGQLVGYYKRPDLDAEVFTADGFFHTGDKGELQSNGLLKITGRLKESFKTSKGKYVAPAPIENRLNTHPMIESAMVSGVGQTAPYAMVVLTEDWRNKLDKTTSRAQVEVELSQLLTETNSNLAHYERLQMIVIAPEPWSMENGYLTPTMKIKRSRIETAVANQLPDWYAAKQSIVWAKS
jgi:long-chain acyl-CoA synthetase